MSYLIYLRKSRKDIESPDASIEDVLSRHEHILLNLARKQNLIIGDIYKEVVSGDSISRRPYMQRLLQEVESGMWDGVLVVEVERLARGDAIDQGVVQRAFQYSNTLIITPTKTYDPTNEFDQEYFEFGLFMSRREYKTIKRRLQSGRYSAATEGKWPFNTAPYGYRRVKLKGEKGWTLEFDEKERPVGELIYQLVTEKGFGISKVRDYLNHNGIKPRKNDIWTDSTLRDFIANPANDGMVFIGKRKTVTTMKNGIPVQSRPRDNNCLKVKGLHPALVSHETFFNAQKHIGNGVPRTSHTIKNPLSGLLICAECSHCMQRRPSSNSSIILCRTPECSTVGSPLDLVEKEVIHALEQFFTPTSKELLQLYWNLPPEQRNLALKEIISKIVYKKQTRNKKGKGNEASFELTIYPKLPLKL